MPKVKKEAHSCRDEYESDRALLKMLVRSREDFQAMRKGVMNRLGVKASGEEQNKKLLTPRVISSEGKQMLGDIAGSAKEQESAVEKKMLKVLRRFKVYNEYLNNVKGIGTISAAHIISSIDIHEAVTVSKIWQYAGMNPGVVVGKVRIENSDGSFEIRQTDKMIRGDRLTPGFVSPFNKSLRVALRGVMADGFIKSQNKYALEYYYPYKTRLEKATNKVPHGPKKELIAWKDTSPGHRDGAAKRYMVKMFLADLYDAWRKIEGLPVRERYQEQYLGHKHVG